MNEETYRILKMLEEGKLSADEAKELIDTLDTQQEQEIPNEAKKMRMLKIEIQSNDPNKADIANLCVNMPIKAAKELTGVAALFPEQVCSDLSEKGIELDKIHLEGLIDMYTNGEIDATLFDMDTGFEQNGARIRIFVE